MNKIFLAILSIQMLPAAFASESIYLSCSSAGHSSVYQTACTEMKSNRAQKACEHWASSLHLAESEFTAEISESSEDCNAKKNNLSLRALNEGKALSEIKTVSGLSTAIYESVIICRNSSNVFMDRGQGERTFEVTCGTEFTGKISENTKIESALYISTAQNSDRREFKVVNTDPNQDLLYFYNPGPIQTKTANEMHISAGDISLSGFEVFPKNLIAH